MASQTATTKLILSNVNPPSITSNFNPDFLLILIESLNPHLQYPIEYSNDPISDTDFLILQLGSLTRDLFNKAFSYVFNDYPSPRNISRPCRPYVFAEFISCPQSCPQIIEAHINTRGPLAARIPRAFARRMARDLYESIKKCFHTSPNKGWQTEVYHRVYGEKLGILPNWAIDAVWVWQLVLAIDWNKSKPTRRSFLLLNYAGVGYATKEMPD
ncbi:putative effector protein [Erysiphe neolycopersici]|uniref:Putative effector protein n=1 Tax=Erysiphe neolycopersici TaxID=212602 RepID=A0A420I3F2_9PEZI|nr:putative effector protein [Erysiphe neolycopersici]